MNQSSDNVLAKLESGNEESGESVEVRIVSMDQ